MLELKSIIKKISCHTWLLAAIIILGAFFRIYNFHNWLEFREDQVRDSYLVGKVIEGNSALPLLGPKMNYTGNSDEASFHLGPIYYYFQIASAKIFGNYPDKMAYPDLFFAIFSIPLFYLFLNIYFNKNLSLALTGLFALSGYFIHYSRFAWNTNLIPFFVILFLLSLYKFFILKKDTPWLWVFSLGIALGVGFQLHAILMLLFSIIAFVAFIISIKNSSVVWKKWAVVLIIFLFVNGPQIYSELKTNFANTKSLFHFTPKEDPENIKLSKVNLVENDVACHIEANFLFLSYYGGTNCSYNLTKLILTRDLNDFLQDKFYSMIWLLGIIFSLAGYWLIWHTSRKTENAEKKIFLKLLIFYCALNFLIMVPLSSQQFEDLRYLMPVFFTPFIFLGLIFNWITKKNSNAASVIIAVILLSFVSFNISESYSEIRDFVGKGKTCNSHIITLGEIEPVANYLADNTGKQSRIYFGGDKTLPVIFAPVEYLLSKQKISTTDIGVRSVNGLNDLEKGIPAFYLSCKSSMKDKYPYKKIDNLYIYTISN